MPRLKGKSSNSVAPNGANITYPPSAYGQQNGNGHYPGDLTSSAISATAMYNAQNGKTMKTGPGVPPPQPPLLKVIMVGSGGVGKSALTLQFMYDEVRPVLISLITSLIAVTFLLLLPKLFFFLIAFFAVCKTFLAFILSLFIIIIVAFC